MSVGDDGEHQDDEGRAKREGARRRAHELEEEQRHQHGRAARIRQLARQRRDARRAGVEPERRHHPAHPDRERDQRDVPDDEHPVIIIAWMEGAAIEWITGTVLAALERGDAVDATALTFLLRRFRDTDRDDLRDALEPALAGGLERQALAETIGERAAWLTLFAEALTLSADDRLLEATTTLLASLQREWGRTKEVEDAAVSVDASLRACGLLDLPSIAPEAVDELERIVAAAYRPGEGLAHSLHDRAARDADSWPITSFWRRRC